MDKPLPVTFAFLQGETSFFPFSFKSCLRLRSFVCALAILHWTSNKEYGNPEIKNYLIEVLNIYFTLVRNLCFEWIAEGLSWKIQVVFVSSQLIVYILCASNQDFYYSFLMRITFKHGYNFLVFTWLVCVLYFIFIDCIALVKQGGNTFGSVCVSDCLSVCMHCQGWTICCMTLIFCRLPNIDWYSLAECQYILAFCQDQKHVDFNVDFNVFSW